MNRDRDSKTVLSYGEALWDLLPTGPQLGGAPLNLACRLQNLGDRGVIVTRLGRDELGQLAALRIAELGMDTGFLQWDDQRPTGTVEVRVDAQGNPDFAILPEVAYDGIEVTYELLELAQQADCFCFGTLAQRSAGSALALERLLAVAAGIPRFLDLNLRKDCYDWSRITRAIEQATLLKLNEAEARQVAFGFDLPADPLPLFCSALLQRCPLACCVVTLGDRGAFALSAGGQRVYEPGYRVTVVDTCGSGDAFSAGFLHEYLRSRPLAECCRLGSALGSLVATQPGATEPLTPAAVEEFLRANVPRVQDPALAHYAE